MSDSPLGWRGRGRGPGRPPPASSTRGRARRRSDMACAVHRAVTLASIGASASRPAAGWRPAAHETRRRRRPAKRWLEAGRLRRRRSGCASASDARDAATRPASPSQAGTGLILLRSRHRHTARAQSMRWGAHRDPGDEASGTHSRDGVRRLRGHARDVPAHRRQRPAWTFRLAMSALRRRGSSDRAMRGQRRVRVVRFSDGGAGGVACRDDRRDRPAVGCRSRSSNWSVIRGRARPSSCSISTARRAGVPGRGVRRDGFVGDTWPPRVGGHRRARGRARAVRAVGP